MIAILIQKELREYRRDGRLIGVTWLIGLLLVTSLVTGWSSLSEQRINANSAQRSDTQTFNNQGEKTPHAAAHFGRMAYKSKSPLSVFDPGTNPYLGQVIWLEAHNQDPAMFRSAEDFLDLRRLADLSVAGILNLLLPLLIFLTGYTCFAGERESGTLRQTISSGVGLRSLFHAKLISVFSVGFSTSLITITASTLLASLAPGQVNLADIFLRGLGLLSGYTVYSFALAAVAVAVSAICQRASSSLLTLLCVWSVAIVLFPRFAATTAEQLNPSPTSHAFWSEAASLKKNSRIDRKSDAYKALERKVISRALNREVGQKEADNLSINRFALKLEISEILDVNAFSEAYQKLYESYQAQKTIRRIASVFSPSIALSHLSSGFSGTDISAHQHFAIAAENQRQLIVRKMNEDMMINGANKSISYIPEPKFWTKIPDFNYQLPTVKNFFDSILLDLLILSLWAVLAYLLAARFTLCQKII